MLHIFTHCKSNEKTHILLLFQLCLVYLGVILFIVVHYANGKYAAPFLKEAMKEGIEHVMDNFNAEHTLNNHLNAFQANVRFLLFFFFKVQPVDIS